MDKFLDHVESKAFWWPFFFGLVAAFWFDYSYLPYDTSSNHMINSIVHVAVFSLGSAFIYFFFSWMWKKIS